MKKLLPIFFFIFLFSSSFSQWCSNTIELGGIDAQTEFTTVSVLEIDHNDAVWISPEWSTFGGQGIWKITDTDTVKFSTGSDIFTYLWPAAKAIAFDKDDSVWVGTKSGLAQFDGINQTGWKIFKTSNSDIPGNDISAIQVDDNNVIWIGTSNGKLATFNNGVWTTVKSFDLAINDIAIDIQGGVWIAKNGTPGLARFYDNAWTDFNEFANIKFITADNLNRILVSAGDSLVVLFNEVIVNVVKGKSDWNLELDDIAVGPGGRVWVSSNRGLLLKSGSRFYRFNQYNSPIQSGQRPVPLEFDADGNLWYSYLYEQGGSPYPGIGYVYRSVEDAETIDVTNVNTADGSIAQPVSDYRVAAFCYGDTVVMNATDAANTYIWNEDATATDRTYKVTDSDTVAMAYKAPDNCYYYDTIRTLAQKVFQDEQICVVTVSIDTHNLVVFEKTPEVGTEFYFLYKETQTDVFEYITQLPAANLSVFVDETSNPMQKSYKYKITSVDTCGNESDVTETTVHKTVHLIFDPELGNLVWQNYEGRYVPKYEIFRGTTPTNFVKVDEVAWDNTTLTWKDVDADGKTLYYYRVGVALDNLCTPTGSAGKKADSGPYSHAMSNIEDNRLQVGILDKLSTNQVNAYPNPFSEYTTIRFDNPDNSRYELIVMDISGKVVRKLGGITGSKVTIERHDLPSGFYTFDLRGKNRFVGKFIIE